MLFDKVRVFKFGLNFHFVLIHIVLGHSLGLEYEFITSVTLASTWFRV